MATPNGTSRKEKKNKTNICTKFITRSISIVFQCLKYNQHTAAVGCSIKGRHNGYFCAQIWQCFTPNALPDDENELTPDSEFSLYVLYISYSQRFYLLKSKCILIHIFTIATRQTKRNLCLNITRQHTLQPMAEKQNDKL